MLVLDQFTPTASTTPLDSGNPPDIRDLAARLEHVIPDACIPASDRHRRKLWELPDLQCSVLGTCLGLAELRQLARRAGLRIPADATDYQVHSICVRHSRAQGFLAKMLHKHLDRKFQRHVRASLKTASDAERAAWWRAQAAAGDIPGPYWALTTHPDIGQELFSEVFGHVHMLSHLVGASNRADIARLQQLETALRDGEEKLAAVKRAYRGRLKTLLDERREQREQGRDRTPRIGVEKAGCGCSGCGGCGGATCGDACACKPSPSSRDSLAFRQLFESLRLAHEEKAQAWRQVEAMERRMERLEAELLEKAQETDVLEAEVTRLLAGERRFRNDGACATSGGMSCDGACDGQCDPSRSGRTLCGKRILYVGGRSNLATHYRDLVESLGGEFLYHDGGREHHPSRLHQLLPSADAVLCPMDCISHDAFHSVKRACCGAMKPCLAMRGASLSSLAKTLACLMDDAAAGREATS